MMEMRTDTRARDELLDMLTQELKQVAERVNEYRMQTEQTQLFVDRKQQQNLDLTQELRFIQDNLDTVPRQDIRAKYDEVMDIRANLASMRGQLDKLNTMRALLEDQQKLLTTIIARLQGTTIAIPEAASEETSSAGRGGLNIVRIIQAQEEERQRLARQMHDGPAQSLTNFILQTEICQRLFDRNPARAAEELNNLKTVAGVTFQKVRDFIFDLRPMMLDDLGVVPTVRRYVDSYKEKNDIDVRLDIIGEERRLQSHREVMIFRSIQELMAQARDYGNATGIDIRLDISGNRIKIVVEDNGRGFDAEAAFSNEDHVQDARVQGMITLREKLELVGGTMSVVSSETEGTTVRLEMPASDEDM